MKTVLIEPTSHNETESACKHCGSPIHQSRQNSGFCCFGCQAVFGLIHQKGLDSYYDIRARENAKTEPVDSNRLKRDWSSLDHAETRHRFSGDGVTIKFHVSDLTCSACVWILERLEQATTDVEWSRLDLSRGILTVRKTAHGAFSNVAHTITQLGFEIEPLNLESSWLAARRKSEKRDLIRLGVMAAITGNIMLLSVPLYGGATGSAETIFRWTMAFLALPVVTWGAWPLYQNTYRALRQRRISLDLPISLAVIAGAAAGIIGLFQKADTLFFDSIAMLVFLIQSSRTGLALLRGRIESIEETPRWFIQPVRETSSNQTLSPDAIKKGTHFALTTGQYLPVDASIRSIGTSWDLAVLTGESLPMAPQYGTLLPAGARLISIRAELEAVAPLQESRVAKLLSEWREGPRTRQSLTSFSDAVGQFFTIVVLTIATILLFSDFSEGQPGWLRALSLLVVTCPCIFGVAIPLAENLAMNRSSEIGLLIKEPSFFERLLKVRKVFFDKTGTLTTGQMVLHKTLIDASNSDVTENEVLAVAAEIEKEDLHPVARALVAAAKERQLPRSLKVLSSSSISTGGRNAVALDGEYTIHTIPAQNLFTNVELSRNGRRLAIFQLQDEIKVHARELIHDLSSRHVKIDILSGDHALPIQRVARALDIDADGPLHANITPQGKAAFVSEANRTESVMMVGDGANDAEALKAASVSIAIKGDFAACLESADAVLLASSMKPLREAFRIARHLRTTLVLGLGFSATFNIFAGTLAVQGQMSPLIAAILMPISSLIVTSTTWFALGRRSKQVAKGVVNGNH